MVAASRRRAASSSASNAPRSPGGWARRGWRRRAQRRPRSPRAPKPAEFRALVADRDAKLAATCERRLLRRARRGYRGWRHAQVADAGASVHAAPANARGAGSAPCATPARRGAAAVQAAGGSTSRAAAAAARAARRQGQEHASHAAAERRVARRGAHAGKPLELLPATKKTTKATSAEGVAAVSAKRGCWTLVGERRARADDAPSGRRVGAFRRVFAGGARVGGSHRVPARAESLVRG